MGNSTCSEQGCDKPPYSRGLCRRDYGIRYRAGTLPLWQQELPFGIHSLANVDHEKKTADCSVCGPVGIRSRSRGKRIDAECSVKRRERKNAFQAKAAAEAKAKGIKSGRPGTSPERVRNYRLWQKYRLTPDGYDAILDAQDGKCAICLQPPGERLHVDHCHKTGIIRGLLCRPCNFAIGYLRDDPESMIRASTYVSRSGRQEVLGLDPAAVN